MFPHAVSEVAVNHLYFPCGIIRGEGNAMTFPPRQSMSPQPRQKMYSAEALPCPVFAHAGALCALGVNCAVTADPSNLPMCACPIACLDSMPQFRSHTALDDDPASLPSQVLSQSASSPEAVTLGSKCPIGWPVL